MRIVPLLGKRLKGDEIVEILEWMEMDVRYDFDRLNEGAPDQYWAESRADGISFRFDEAQTLATVFLYVRPLEGYTPVDPEFAADIRFFASIAEVEEDATARGLRIVKSAAPASASPGSGWIRVAHDGHDVHYQFQESVLTLVTVMRRAP